MNEWSLERLLRLEQRVTELEKKIEAPAIAGRSRQLPADWEPDAALLAWLKDKGLKVDETAERDKFKDYWIAKGEARRDWSAAYRNWLRKAEEFSASRPSVLRGGSRSRTADIDQVNRERRDRYADKLASLWRKPT